jgi:hypothetical protein
MSDETKTAMTDDDLPRGNFAFPFQHVTPDGKGGHYYSNCTGMHLRDYFAGQAIPEAMHSVLASAIADNHADLVARVAYEVADAMLRARAK